jgi:bacterial/archaeal transporter family-2 protein
MDSRTIYLLAVLAGGAILPVQVALNTLLRRYVGEPMQVTFISYLAGTIASLIICCLSRYSFPSSTALSQTSWWMWIGGCLGTFYVWSTRIAGVVFVVLGVSLVAYAKR